MAKYNIADIRSMAQSGDREDLIGKTAYLWSFDMYEGLIMSNMGMNKRVINDISSKENENFVSNGESFRYAILTKPEKDRGGYYKRMFGVDFTDSDIISTPEKGEEHIGKYVILGSSKGKLEDVEWDSPTILTEIDPSSPTMFKGKGKFDVGECMLPMGDWLPENKVILEYQPYDFHCTEDLKDFLERTEDEPLHKRSDGSDCTLLGIREELRYMEKYSLTIPNTGRNDIYTAMLRVVNPYTLMLGYVFADGTPCGKRCSSKG